MPPAEARLAVRQRNQRTATLPRRNSVGSAPLLAVPTSPNAAGPAARAARRPSVLSFERPVNAITDRRPGSASAAEYGLKKEIAAKQPRRVRHQSRACGGSGGAHLPWRIPVGVEKTEEPKARSFPSTAATSNDAATRRWRGEALKARQRRLRTHFAASLPAAPTGPSAEGPAARPAAALRGLPRLRPHDALFLLPACGTAGRQGRRRGERCHCNGHQLSSAAVQWAGGGAADKQTQRSQRKRSTGTPPVPAEPARASADRSRGSGASRSR